MDMFSGKQILIPIVALVLLAVFNLIADPSFYKITLDVNSAGNHVLSGYLITILDYGSELAILAIGMTLVTAASGGQDISVGAGKLADLEEYNRDREVWRRIYKQFIQNNEDLDAFLEEKSLYWNDDKDIIDTFVLKTIKRFDPANKANQELLPEYKDMEDREFARKLFRATILNADEYQKYMGRISRNWDFSRLAYMDMVIMQIAIAELVNFPGIPATVTINEYVELSKIYSTPRSGGYVNGMLDAIARSLIETGVIMKELPERPHREQNVQRRAGRGGFGVHSGAREGQQRRQRIGQPRYRNNNGNDWNDNNGYQYDQPSYDQPSYDQPAEPTAQDNAAEEEKYICRH